MVTIENFIYELSLIKSMKKVISLLLVFFLLVSNVTALRLNSKPKISPYITETLAKQAKMKVDIYLEDPVLHKNLSPEQRNKVLDQIPSSKISKIYEEAVTAELTLEEINKLAQKQEVKRSKK